MCEFNHMIIIQDQVSYEGPQSGRPWDQCLNLKRVDLEPQRRTYKDIVSENENEIVDNTQP